MKPKKSIKLATLAIGLIAGLGGANPAHAAGTLAGTLNAQLTLSASCIITGLPGTLTGLSFGTLDFGTQPSTFTGALSSLAPGVVGGLALTLTCSPNLTGVTMSIGGGQNSTNPSQTNGVGTRAMRIGASTDIMPYDVYSDSGHGTVYPLTGGLGLTIPDTGAALDLPIYGYLNKTTSNALAFGSYTDQLIVTIAW
jgi:spore coat protein U-like protein